MSDGSMRPGGLMALAIINFVVAGLGSLLALLYVVGLSMGSPGANQGYVYLLILTGLEITAVILLIASGIGYLMMKRVLGRFLGTTYGVVALATSIVTIILYKDMGRDVGLLQFVGVIYPVLTIILLNTSFRKDLVN